MNNYNRIASFYDSLARLIFGKKLLQAKRNFLHTIPENSYILIIGGGTGDIMNDILKDRKGCMIDFIEPSEKMISIAEKNVSQEGKTRVRFIHGDQRDIPAAATYDAVITFFVLDLFPQQIAQAFAETVNAHLRQNGIWLFADFFRTKNIFQRFILWLMYRFFKVATHIQSSHVPDYEAIFSNMHFTKEDEYPVMNGFVRSIYWRKSIYQKNNADKKNL